MRKALTLIELIFTMVIVAITFSVIPKLIQTVSSANAVSKKEDAIYNSIALMGKIINQPWDEANTRSNAILRVQQESSDFTCHGTRRFGFVSGRNCNSLDATIPSATAIGQEGTTFNDIDDFNAQLANAKITCGANKKNLYDLGVAVSYIANPDNLSSVSTQSTNFKLVQITTKYDSNIHNDDGEYCVVMDYVSYNIGLTKIKRRRWL